MVFFEDDDGAVLFFREVFVDFFFGLENVPPDGRLRTREEDRVFRFCGIGLPGEEGVLLVALPFFAEEGLAAALPLLGVRLKGDFLLGVDCVVEDNIALREWLYTCLLLRVLTMSAISFQLGPHFLYPFSKSAFSFVDHFPVLLVGIDTVSRWVGDGCGFGRWGGTEARPPPELEIGHRSASYNLHRGNFLIFTRHGDAQI